MKQNERRQKQLDDLYAKLDMVIRKYNFYGDQMRDLKQQIEDVKAAIRNQK